MTAAPAGPSGPSLFSMFSESGFSESGRELRTRREAFLLSLLGQALIVILLAWLAITVTPPPVLPGRTLSNIADQLPVLFSGPSGGSGGHFDKIPASHGAPPPSSVIQLAPPSAVPTATMPQLPVQATVMLAPEVKFAPDSQIGDPLSKFNIPSNGPGGPSGIGDNCCDGVGPGHGTGVGPGGGGLYVAGKAGVTVPRVIYNPEPSFSEEARKARAQGLVTLLLVVGKDGRTHDVRVQQSLGMGLDEKAIEAVRNWRFLPATFKGEPVDAQIAIEVQFHIY